MTQACKGSIKFHSKIIDIIMEIRSTHTNTTITVNTEIDRVRAITRRARKNLNLSYHRKSVTNQTLLEVRKFEAENEK